MEPREKDLVLITFDQRLAWVPAQAGHVVWVKNEKIGVRVGTHIFVRQLRDEGIMWVRGWYGEIPDAFRAQVALLNEA